MVPLDIIENIGRYVVPLPHWSVNSDISALTRQKVTADLIELMSVCREWRAVVYPRFYQVAMFRVTNRKTPSKLKIPMVNSELAEKYQTSIRKLVVSIDMSMIIVSGSPAEQLESCCVLPSVRRIVFDFTPDIELLPEADRRELLKGDLLSQIIPENLRAISKRMAEIAPDAREISIHRDILFPVSQTYSSIDPYVLKHLSELLPAHLNNPEKVSTPTVPAALDATESMGLRMMELRYSQSGGCELELAMRFSGTLERLHISGLWQGQIGVITVDESQPNRTRVFPRLKHLIIRYSNEPRQADLEQPQTNPFPRLQTLICGGNFPFSSALIFEGGQTRFTHIDIELDHELLNNLQTNEMLEKNSYTRLNYASLAWSRTSRRGYSYECARELTTAATELCRGTRVLKLFNRPELDISQMLPGLEFPLFLQRLDIKDVMLDIENLVELLDRLKYLYTATVGLNCNLECPEQGEASDEDIIEFQERLKNNTASVRVLSVNALGYQHFPEAAENGVLLADALPKVTHMSLYSYSCVLTSEIELIDSIRARPMYRNNARLAGVEYSLLCSVTGNPLRKK